MLLMILDWQTNLKASISRSRSKANLSFMPFNNNAVADTQSPGMIETPGLNGLAQNQEQLDQFKTSFVFAVPLGRIGRPDEVAKAVSFISSENSSYINGIELFVDGGVAQI
jgi:enoyl-[acyl-carrier-protein] reductase (NADH)